MPANRQASFTLTRPQHAWLAAEAARLHVSEAEVVRRIIDLYRERIDRQRKTHMESVVTEWEGKTI